VDVGPRQAAAGGRARLTSGLRPRRQGAGAEEHEDRPAAHGQRPAPGDEGGSQRGNSKRGDRGIEAIRGGDAEAGEEAGQPALGQGPPKAEKEDRPGRRGDAEAQGEAFEQKAEHRIASWRRNCINTRLRAGTRLAPREGLPLSSASGRSFTRL